LGGEPTADELLRHGPLDRIIIPPHC
jgi:hypothetical protein